jgi:CTP:molybdopterin cytidylyltransferase MocA
MGEPKGLVSFEGRPWLEHQLEALRGARVTVVLGADHERYRRALPELGARATIVINPAPDRGPFSSLLEGLRTLVRERSQTPTGLRTLARERSQTPTRLRTLARESVFVLPVDVPAASAPVWVALADALRAEPDAWAAVPSFGGRGGHPVLLAPRLVAELRAMRPVWGAADAPRLDRELRSRAVARVPVDDPRVGLNLNTREDWEKVPRGR